MTLKQLVRNRVMEAHPSTVMVRREALLGPIGLVDEELPGSYGEDFDWIIRAAKAGGFAVVAEPLVKVRWGQSMFSQRWQTIIDSIDYSLAKHSVFHEDPQALGRLYGRKAFAHGGARPDPAGPRSGLAHACGSTPGSVAPTSPGQWPCTWCQPSG